MAIGVLNPRDDAHASNTRPAAVRPGAATRRWYTDGAQLYGQDLNDVLAQFRYAFDQNGIADVEGDDTGLAQLITLARLGQGLVTRGDADFTIAATDRAVAITTAFTAARTASLPPAGLVPPGRSIMIADIATGISTFTPLLIAADGSDTINGMPAANLFEVRHRGALIILFSDGLSRWLAIEPGSRSRRNFCANPSMELWQAGASFTTAGHIADLWLTSTAAGRTYSRQAGFGGARYCVRVQRDASDTATTAMGVAQILPAETTIQLSGQTIVVSCDVRAGANYSASPSNIVLVITTGTGLDEAYTYSAGTFPTGSVSSTPSQVGVSATAKRVVFEPYLVPSNAIELAIRINTGTLVGTAGAADYIEITNVKIEIGHSPSLYFPEPRELVSLQGKRQFEMIDSADAANTVFATGYATSTTHGLFVLQYEVKKRSVPLIVVTGASTNFELQRQGGAVVATTALAATAGRIGRLTCELDATVASGLTAGEALILKAKNTSAKIEIDARL